MPPTLARDCTLGFSKVFSTDASCEPDWRVVLMSVQSTKINCRAMADRREGAHRPPRHRRRDGQRRGVELCLGTFMRHPIGCDIV